MACLPSRGTPFSAGLDLSACESGIIFPGKRVLIRTGIKILLPKQTYGRIASRSSLAFFHSIDVCAGVIDESYVGEIKIVLANNGDVPFSFKSGQRIAQLIIEKIKYLEPIEDPDFDEDPRSNTLRSTKGFGSTDKN